MLNIKTYPTVESMQFTHESRGKFVQLCWKDEPWLLFAIKDQHAFHNQIIAHFLSEQHIPFHWKSPEILEFTDSEFEILGGGKFQLNWEQKKLSLFGDSMVYGRFDVELLEASMKHTGLPWAQLSIEIK